MITLYYIGGPWDMVKRALPGNPVPVITIRQFDGFGESGDMLAGEVMNPNAVEVRHSDHRYATRRIGLDTWIAIHEGLRP